MTLPWYINGRILLRDHGGVRRYAQEVADRLPASVVQPRSARRAWSARLWEQTALLRETKDGVLLNMAHSAPVRHPRQVNVVHDLLALQHPAQVSARYGALLRWQLPRVVSNAAAVVAVSAKVAHDIASMFAVERADIRVIAPGISNVFGPGDVVAARRRLGLDPDRRVVSALLDPTPRKNSALVAQLLHELQQDDSSLQIVVAGRSAPAAFARRRTSSPTNSELRSSSWFDLGPAADIELATMYQAADVFVALSDGEGFGLPMVEAAVCGAAVVTTPVPSISEHASQAAITVNTATEAKAAATGLLKEPQQRHELAEAAQHALGDLRWGQTAASLGAMMSEVAET